MNSKNPIESQENGVVNRLLAVFIMSISLLLGGCSTSAQTGAAITLGATALAFTGVQASNHSKLSVTVEKYTPAAGAEQPAHNPVPVNLSARGIDVLEIGSEKAILDAYERLIPTMADFSILSGRIGVLNEGMNALPKSSPYVAELLSTTDLLATGSQNIVSDWNRLRETIASSSDNGILSPAGVDAARIRMRGLRLRIAEFHAATRTSMESEVLASATRQTVESILITRSNRDQIKADLNKIDKNATRVSARILEYRQYFEEHRPKSFTDGNKANMAQALQDLFSLPDLMDRMAIVSRNARSATFETSIRNGLNLGPLRDEGIQMVLADPNFSSVVKAEEDDWSQVNSAYSTGHTGNHNVTIYLENLATPVLKTSNYDPSAFIDANGIAFQKAFETASAIYGLPVGSGDPQASSLDSPMNLHTLDRRKTAAEEQLRQERAKTLELMRFIESFEQEVKNGDPKNTTLKDEWKKILEVQIETLRK